MRISTFRCTSDSRREQQRLLQARKDRLARAHAGELPDYLPPSEATQGHWRIELPGWCADQRNQMTGPADDAELCVKMLNSGAPGVMLDLEDSMANTWDRLMLGHRNIVAALARRANVRRRQTRTNGRDRAQRDGDLEPRARPASVASRCDLSTSATSASLFDLALLAFRVGTSRMQRPLCIYIPKSESAEEALWWRDVFDALIEGMELGARCD